MKLHQYHEMSEAIEKTLPAVNELLPGASPMGSYCLGLICALAWEDRAQPPRSLLDMAARCDSIEQAAALWQEFHVLRETMDARARAVNTDTRSATHRPQQARA